MDQSKVPLSPSQLNCLTECCPAALRFYREGHDQPHDDAEGTEPMDFGVIAHACLHAAALAEQQGKPRIPAVEATALVLATKYNPRLVREAADHALEWVFDKQFFKTDLFEHGVAFNDRWEQVPWIDKDEPMEAYVERTGCRFRMIFDVLGVFQVEDEDYGPLTVAKVQDYKTGHAVCEDDLDGVQAMAFTTALSKLYPEADAYEVCLEATRLKTFFKRRWVVADEEDAADLRRREERLLWYMNVACQTDFAARTEIGRAHD